MIQSVTYLLKQIRGIVESSVSVFKYSSAIVFHFFDITQIPQHKKTQTPYSCLIEKTNRQENKLFFDK